MHFNLSTTFYLAASLVTLASPAASQTSNEYTSNNDFRDTILSITNTYRRQHNATSLTWNETLVDSAKDWSEECKFEHGNGAHGENLASGYQNVSSSVLAWGHERENYNFRSAEFSTATGHFTQLVWKSTQSLGCARTECNSGQANGTGTAPGWYIVCHYHPGGNVIGQFGDNVQDVVKEADRPAGPKDGRVRENEQGAAGRLEGGIGPWALLAWSLGWTVVLGVWP